MAAMAVCAAEIPGGRWMAAEPVVTVENEVTGVRMAPPAGAVKMDSRWSGSRWELNFTAEGPRVGHTVRIAFAVLKPGLRVFTPSERGVMEVDAHPDYHGVEYGHMSWKDGRAWVLPLVSVMDPAHDMALTMAFAPDENLPNLEVEWSGGRVLGLVLKHRGIGGGRDSRLSLMLMEHAADYRAALGAYSGMFPEYFRPVVRGGDGEGTFYYHHIQEHPALDEMRAQRVRYLWSSFWFTHLGEYLPPAKEWTPYTFGKPWNLGEKMSDERIRGFVRKMDAEGIRTFAYFNVTEYGDKGEGGRILRERFANALMRNEKGADIPTWEGAMAMNPGRRYALWPFLEEQAKRHLERLPEIAGFIIDRLDWASKPDWGHTDGLSMDGARAFENTALPVAEAVQNVCRLAHAAGKRVYVNQFYRAEVLKNTDGVCHENDYLPALGYLTPLKPASAWHLREKYHGDLLRFEAQMKRRLEWALFPQMIAHQFKISQQEPDARAADLQELYAPLFEPLIGKRQVLEAHVVEVSGANDANLFVNGEARYVVPVTSRVRFLTRGNAAEEDVTLRVKASAVQWATVYRLGKAPVRVPVKCAGEVTEVVIPGHGTASVVVLGRDVAPPVGSEAVARTVPAGKGPAAVEAKPGELRIEGEAVGAPGRLEVLADGRHVGWLEGKTGSFALPANEPGRVELRAGDEGVWFVVSSIRAGKKEWSPAEGRSGRGSFTGSQWYELRTATP
jgi:hypothetical protein